MSTCSYTALNRNCRIVIDRAFPASPPTIYARYGSTVTIEVDNALAFEQLSLDFSSAKTVVPTDSFQAFMAGQSSTLQKLAIINLSKGREAELNPPLQETTLTGISNEQAQIYSAFDLNTILPLLAQVMTTNIPASACDNARAYSLHLPKSVAPPNPWYNFADWKRETLNEIGSDRSGKLVNLADVETKIQSLDSEITKVSQSIAALSSSEQSTLTPLLNTVVQNQSTLKARTELIQWVNQLSVTTPQTFTVPDHSSRSGEWTQATWSLNAANTAAPVLKRVMTSPYKPSQPGDIILNPAPKQPVATITVQYQSVPHVEISAGLMVPTLPFHSYAVAATSSNGTVTGNVVQETQTYTVVPLALVNVSLWQGVARRQPVATFASIGTGYNPATSGVEFGLGGSFSWKSLQVGLLADIGRDQQLSGGFHVGQQLPISNPPKPPTTTFWSVKPAISLSVRIPITGASK